MFTIDTQAATVRRTVATICRNACTVGLMAVLLSACGGGGGGSSPAADNANPSGGSASNTGLGGGSGGGGSGGSGSGGSGSGGGSNAPTAGLTKPVVYLANQDIADSDELYVTIPGAPGTTTKISASLVAGGWVDDFYVMPSGDSVVYTADQDILGRYELFMVSLANPGVSTRMNAPLTPNRDVLDFTVSPDSTQVLYRADGDVADVLELYLVNIASPGQPQKVNGTLVAGGDVLNEFMFSPDGATIGYIADQETDETLELFVVPTSALGNSMKVSGPLVADGDVCRFKFSPNSERVAYCADEKTDGVIELFTVSLAAPEQSVKLNPTLVAGGRVNSDFVFSADSSFIVYTSEQDVSGLDELFMVEIANPGVSTKLMRLSWQAAMSTCSS